LYYFYQRMADELLYRLALTLIPHIGPVQARILVDRFGGASGVFHAKKSELEQLEGIGTVRAAAVKAFRDFSAAEAEIAFLEKYKITPLFLSDPGYPKRLLNCYDPPTLLYYRGRADLNTSRIIAVIGTRGKTDYGKQVTEELVRDLAEQQVLVISGLALGIDALAHKSAIKAGLPTVGVLAHGLDKMYPAEHRGLAKDILSQGGGLLTEFRSNTKPGKHHFPTRNRVVAGMSDAVIVVETAVKGGSMITAELANGYNKDVFAFPGRVTDNKSAGCNFLIKTNKVMLLSDAGQLIEVMGWQPSTSNRVKKQRELFIQLTENEKIVVGLIREKETMHIDEINLKSGLSSSAVAAAMLNLELQNVIDVLPGKLYKLA
jgi:DNA processing protein